MADNIILNIPFDELSGSLVAYDYSDNRADAIIEGATFIPGREGNAIHFTGKGVAQSAKTLSLQNEFTLTFWLKPLRIEGNLDPKTLSVLFAFNGVDQYLEHEFDIQGGVWSFVSIVRSLTEIKIYLNSSHAETLAIPELYGNLLGYSVLQDYYGGDYGYADVYDLKAFSAALSATELNKVKLNRVKLSYIIDGVDLKDWDTFVSSSQGIVDGLKMKEPFKVEWSGEHGEVLDLNRPRFDVREIILNCFMKADGRQSFLAKSQNFLSQFRKPGTRRLAINVHPTKPLVYEVYIKDGIQIEKTWSDELMVGTFQLKLREPEPVKRVLKYIRTSASNQTVTITLSSNKMLNIYWGDGTKTFDVHGQDKTITHTYDGNGEFHIVITGVIEEITSFTTNAIVVWNNL